MEWCKGFMDVLPVGICNGFEESWIFKYGMIDYHLTEQNLEKCWCFCKGVGLRGIP